MNNNQLMEKVSSYRKIAICGCTDYGIYIKNLIKETMPEVDIIVGDNSKKKQVNGVADIDSICKDKGERLFLLATSSSNSFLFQQLCNNGVSASEILDGVTEEAKAAVQAERYKNKTTPLKKIRLEINIAEHCNLNCKCCSQFSCIADEEFIDLNVMRSDLQQLGKLFGGECERIYLIGGEPLLHPNVCECMNIARNSFPKGKIFVFTNGTLILKQKKAFWDTCRKNDISIIITRYPIDLDYEKILDFIRQEKVSVEFFGTSDDFKYMRNLGLDLDGKQDVNKSFALCAESNNCIKLRNGRLYTCTRPPEIYKFNKQFNKHLEMCEQDGIDIYKVLTGQEILDFLARPIPFCRYCNLEVRRDMDWGITQKDISEWTS